MTVVLKACLGLASLTGGACAIGIPLLVGSSPTIPIPESRGGAVAPEEREKGNPHDLDKLVKLSEKALINDSDIEPRNIPEITLSRTISKDQGKESIGHLSNFEESVGDLNTAESSEVSAVMRPFFEYIVDEWAKTQGESTGSGVHGGTSGGSDVMMTGRSSGDLKEVLLKIKLKQNTDAYVIGQYKKNIEVLQEPTGELTLGFVRCNVKTGSQCQINKGQTISPRLQLKISSNN